MDYGQSGRCCVGAQGRTTLITQAFVPCTQEPTQMIRQTPHRAHIAGRVGLIRDEAGNDVVLIKHTR